MAKITSGSDLFGENSVGSSNILLAFTVNSRAREADNAKIDWKEQEQENQWEGRKELYVFLFFFLFFFFSFVEYDISVLQSPCLMRISEEKNDFKVCINKFNAIFNVSRNLVNEKAEIRQCE